MEGYLAIAVVLALAVLPLVAIYPTAPKMFDDDEDGENEESFDG